MSGCCPKAVTRTRSKTPGSRRYLATTLKHARTAGQVTSRPLTRASCGGTPTRISPSPPTGSLGQLTARAEAHVIRLALIYALLDGQKTIQPEHLTRRARALGLRRTLRRLGTRTSNRRPARRAASTPHSPAHPTGSHAPRSATSANATSPPTASSKHSTRSPPPAAPSENGPSPAAAPPNSGPPRRHPAPDPPQPRASGSHRSPSDARAATPSRVPPPPSWRAINSESEAVSTRDAPPRAPQPGRPHRQPFPTPPEACVGPDQRPPGAQAPPSVVQSLPATSSPSTLTPPSPSWLSVQHTTPGCLRARIFSSR